MGPRTSNATRNTNTDTDADPNPPAPDRRMQSLLADGGSNNSRVEVLSRNGNHKVTSGVANQSSLFQPASRGD